MAETSQLQGLAEPTVTETAGLKDRVLRETVRFARMFAYLLAMFTLFQLHEYVVLAKQQISYSRWGFALINALVLAKVMLVAHDLGLGAWRGFRAPIYIILTRSVLFAAVFFAFDIVEKVLVGAFHGRSIAESLPTYGSGGVLGTVLVGIIVSVALIPFFAVEEISRAMGPGEFTKLLFNRGDGSGNPQNWIRERS
jgi:hypothetical protein